MKDAKKAVATTAVVASALLVPGVTSNGQDMSKPLVGDEIRSIKIHFSKSELDDLRRRVAATKFPDKETVNDQSQGVQLATTQALVKYWSTEYDWSKVEAKINSYPNFMTNIDGLNIHFIHVRSKEPNAMPLMLTHGWPGSIVEFLKIIDPLVDPVKYGGKSSDAFDVIIPSIPGFGFSGKPTATGWNPDHIARAWGVLMTRLGYKKYVSAGGDWGALIVELQALQKPDGLVGISTNMPGALPPEVDKAAWAGGPAPAGLSEEEKAAFDRVVFCYQHVAYATMMGSRPQSLAGLADSPMGLAAFLLDHDARSYELIKRSFNGQKEGLSRDDVLDNITLYWLTNTALSAARIYWEYKGGYFNVRGVTLPVAVSAFPDELYQCPRSWAEKAYPKLVHYSKLNKGGHFAAWEQPELYTQEMRESFKSLR